jgi:hypothetical protein
MHAIPLDDTQRRRVVDAFHRSGLTMAQFGARHHVNPSTLEPGVRKFRDLPLSSVPAFLELRVPDAAKALRRVRPDGRSFTIEVPPPSRFLLVLRPLGRPVLLAAPPRRRASCWPRPGGAWARLLRFEEGKAAWVVRREGRRKLDEPRRA